MKEGEFLSLEADRLRLEKIQTDVDGFSVKISGIVKSALISSGAGEGDEIVPSLWLWLWNNQKLKVLFIVLLWICGTAWKLFDLYKKMLIKTTRKI